jgi:membrane-bound lytic murein transglycosylase
MKTRIPRLLVPALLAATIPATAVLAQAQPQPQPEPGQKRERTDRPRLSPDARKRLQEGRQEGRITEMKQALKLNDAQLKLWAPVEQQLRASFAARQQAREAFEQRRQQGATATQPPSLTDRLDRASKRMTERAQRMQAFTGAFKPFYEALSEEQKAVAGIVLKDMRGGMRGPGRRWAMEHHMHRGPSGPSAPGAEQPPR